MFKVGPKRLQIEPTRRQIEPLWRQIWSKSSQISGSDEDLGPKRFQFGPKRLQIEPIWRQIEPRRSQIAGFAKDLKLVCKRSPIYSKRISYVYQGGRRDCVIASVLSRCWNENKIKQTSMVLLTYR